MVINTNYKIINMKKIIYSLLIGTAVVLGTSCMKIDNLDAPDAHFYGKVIDSTTGKNILASQGECRIRIYEKSYSENPAPQDIPLKQDGTFNNTKLFSGEYDVVPEGAWWPAETQRVSLDKKATQDFTVTPYLQVLNLKHELKGKYLHLSCQIKAPVKEGLPKVIEVRPYINNKQFCGSNACIGVYLQRGNQGEFREDYCKRLMKDWNEIEQEDGLSPVYNFKLEMKAGYVYYVRVGAKVMDSFRNCNYSEIIKVEVPNDAK